MTENNLLEIAKSIMLEYPLCDRCLGRQFPTFENNDSKSRGESIRKINCLSNSESCYICNGTMQSINDLCTKILTKLENYDFEDFLIGASLPREISEREDELRSKFKLRGGEAIKSEITRSIGTYIVSQTCKEVNFHKPDLTIIIDFNNYEVNIISKSVFAFGRYLKTKRGIPQKKNMCKYCKGEGCNSCQGMGYERGESVENFLAEQLLILFKGRSVKFSWIGTESPESIVSGKGRPFFAEIHQPKVRKIDKFEAIDNQKGLTLKEIKIVNKRPQSTPNFILNVSASIKFDENVDIEKLLSLENQLQNRDIRIKYINKILNKKIYKFKVELVDNREAKIFFTCDGGLNIKSFINDLNFKSDKKESIERKIMVTPNITKILSINSSCNFFDIIDVDIINRID